MSTAAAAAASGESPQLPYVWVHIYCTLPTILILAWLASPWLSRLHFFKMAVLSMLAFVYATPWDNYLVWRGGWDYVPGSVLGVIAYVPVEEYAFFVLQTVLATLMTSLVFQFADIPTRYLVASGSSSTNTNTSKETAQRYLPLVAMSMIAAWGWQVAQPHTPTFYLGAELWWAMPIIMLEWGLVGPYILRQARFAIVAIALPTLFMCTLDTWAISRRSWTISTENTTGIMLNQYLPLEEAVFFLLTNIMLVFGYMDIDRYLAIMKVQGTLPLFLKAIESRRGPVKMSQVWQALKQAATANLQEPAMQQTIRDTQVACDVMRQGSKSFSLAACLFPWDLRHDVTAVYAFCRVTDDMADNANESISVRREQILAVQTWLDAIYTRKAKEGTMPLPLIKLSATQQAALRHFRRFAALHVPLAPLRDLLQGYLWDLQYDEQPVDSTADLVRYSQYVASTVGVMMTQLIFERDGRPCNSDNPATTSLLQHASDMGVALQLVNIARDLVTDARMGRIYAPPDFWVDAQLAGDGDTDSSKLGQADRKARLDARVKMCSRIVATYSDARSVSAADKHKVHAILCRNAERLVNLAQEYAESAETGIKGLPCEYRAAIRAALRVYMSIGHRVLQRCNTGVYPVRAVVPKWRQLATVLKVLYGPSE
ncbi:hypothetical protein RI367_000332 [Sorochytrium milnesiophthora]